MTQQPVNIGTGPNTKNGDTVRNAFTKVNHNFDEIYTSLEPMLTQDQSGNVGKILSSDGTHAVWIDTIDGGAV
jgi:hypothetical protein